MMQTHLPPYWRQKLLHVLGCPVVHESLRLLTAWQHAEGGTARWNPLNTEYVLYGASDYNPQGVKNYLNPIDGICATACTLANGYYNGILGALQGGHLTAEQIVERHAAEFDTWGTGSAHVLAALKTVT